jgi:hypothetical protein
MVNSPNNGQSTSEEEMETDTYLVDQVLEQTDKSASAFVERDLHEQLEAMRYEIDRIGQSLALLSAGARSIALQAPVKLEAELTRRVVKRPVYYVALTTAFSFALSSLLLPGKPLR